MILIVSCAYLLHFVALDHVHTIPFLHIFTGSIFELINTMWHGILIGIMFVGILSGIPRSLLNATIGNGGTFNGILRATAGGMLLDLCSHGILLVGMQLYKKGASLGQVMAFLIASPWNSLSLTIILWTLVGLQWTLLIILLSMIIAILSGLIFERLVTRGVLPANPYQSNEKLPSLGSEVKKYFSSIKWAPSKLIALIKTGLIESKMILRWIFFGIVLAAAVRTVMAPEIFTEIFGPTLLGLSATLLVATILEVCSEGSMTFASDFC